LFEPKLYKTNNVESHHLLSEDGGSFLYEGKVEYDDSHLYKDEQGRAYYLVTTDISGNSKYFVEVEPLGIPIPKAEKKEKPISELIMASPRDDQHADAPAPKEVAAEPEKKVADTVQEAVETATPVKQPDNCFESPENAPAAQAMPEEPKAETPPAPQPTITEEPRAMPEEPKAEAPPAPQPIIAEEARAAVKAMASLQDNKPRKKRRLFTITAIAALIVIILVVCAAGVYVYKPSVYTSIKDRLKPDITPTPIAPTVTPTPEPSITATPIPTDAISLSNPAQASPAIAPAISANGSSTATPIPTDAVSLSDPSPALPAIALAISGNNSSVQAFVNNSSNPYGTSYSSFDIICDVFDYLNKHWTLTQGNNTPQLVNTSITTMNGSAMDYSVLMASVVQLEGMGTRVVAAPDENTNQYNFYPEVLIATNDDGYSDALMYLQSRYGNQTSPFVQQDGTDYWLSLAMGKTPGQGVDSQYAYSVTPQGEVYAT
jgi:hypothetical protein